MFFVQLQCLAHIEAFIDFSEGELIEDGVLNQGTSPNLGQKNKIKPHLWGIFPSTKWETSCLQQSVCSITTVWKYYWIPSAEMSSWRNWQSSFVIQNDYHSYVLSVPVIISCASGLGRGALYLYCGVFLKRILALCSASRNKVFIDHLLPLSDISLAGCGYKLKCKQKLALNQSWRDFAC